MPISPAIALDVIANHFKARKAHTAAAVCGAKCEQWLNFEARVALMSHSPPLISTDEHLWEQETPSGWSGIPDHLIYRLKAGTKCDCIQVFEGKIIDDGTPSTVKSQLEELRRQLELARACGVQPGFAVGLVYIIQVSSRHTTDGKLGKYPTADELWAYGRAAVEKAFQGSGAVCVPAQGVCEIFKREQACWVHLRPLVQFGMLAVVL